MPICSEARFFRKQLVGREIENAWNRFQSGVPMRRCRGLGTLLLAWHYFTQAQV